MNSLRVTFQAGALIRRQVISQLKQYCFRNGLELSVDEDKGFLESTYFVDIKGPDEALITAKHALESWVRTLDD